MVMRNTASFGGVNGHTGLEPLADLQRPTLQSRGCLRPLASTAQRQILRLSRRTTRNGGVMRWSKAKSNDGFTLDANNRPWMILPVMEEAVRASVEDAQIAAMIEQQRSSCPII